MQFLTSIGNHNFKVEHYYYNFSSFLMFIEVIRL